MHPTLVLADDHQIVRQSLKMLLEHQGFQVIGEASNGLEAVSLVRQLRPDVVVLDYAMPSLNGIDAAAEIRRTVPSTRAILLTMCAEDSYVLEALRAGITGYVVKTQAAEDLVRAIHEVSRDAVYLSPGISRTVVEACLGRAQLPSQSLSPRERQVLQLIAESKTTKEVASVLGLSVKTAESHRAHLMEKLGIHDTAGLVRYAVRRGMIQP